MTQQPKYHNFEKALSATYILKLLKKHNVVDWVSTQMSVIWQSILCLSVILAVGRKVSASGVGCFRRSGLFETYRGFEANCGSAESLGNLGFDVRQLSASPAGLRTADPNISLTMQSLVRGMFAQLYPFALPVLPKRNALTNLNPSCGQKIIRNYLLPDIMLIDPKSFYEIVKNSCAVKFKTKLICNGFRLIYIVRTLSEIIRLLMSMYVKLSDELVRKLLGQTRDS
jgi:hypothetical protein